MSDRRWWVDETSEIRPDEFSEEGRHMILKWDSEERWSERDHIDLGQWMVNNTDPMQYFHLLEILDEPFSTDRWDDRDDSENVMPRIAAYLSGFIFRELPKHKDVQDAHEMFRVFHKGFIVRWGTWLYAAQKLQYLPVLEEFIEYARNDLLRVEPTSSDSLLSAPALAECLDVSSCTACTSAYPGTRCTVCGKRCR